MNTTVKRLGPLSATFIAASFAALLSTPALAVKVDMTPGLWEHSFTITSKGGEMDRAMKEMQQQLANMPAEQRKMVEDMMAAQGVSFDSSGTNTTVKVCITQDDIDKGALPQHDDECTQEIIEHSKNKFKATFVCNTKPSSSGTTEIHFTDAKNYTGESVFVTEVGGKAEQMSMTQSGKWLSADCGKLKPAQN